MWFGPFSLLASAPAVSLSAKAQANGVGGGEHTEESWKARMKGREMRDGSSIKQSNSSGLL